MNIFSRLKTDKIFRNKVIIGVIFFLVIINTMPAKKEWTAQEICNEAGGITVQDRMNECEAIGCVLTGKTTSTCKSCGELGDYVFKPNMCCSGKSEEVKTGLDLIDWIGDLVVPEMYKCEYTANPINANEMEIASIVQEMGLFENDAKMAYYAVIIGGIFMIILLMGVIM